MKTYNNLTEAWLHTRALILNEYGSINNFCNVTKIGTPQNFNPYNTFQRVPKMSSLNKVLKLFGKRIVFKIVDVKPHPSTKSLDESN